jgi:hypothetical protein
MEISLLQTTIFLSVKLKLRALHIGAANEGWDWSLLEFG